MKKIPFLSQAERVTNEVAETIELVKKKKEELEIKLEVAKLRLRMLRENDSPVSQEEREILDSLEISEPPEIK